MAGNDFDIEVLARLFAVIESRKGAAPEDSYTAKLFADGRETMVRKLGEEATETVVAALVESHEDLLEESADLLYHLLVLWAAKGVRPDEVYNVLYRRRIDSDLKKKKQKKHEA